MKILVAVLLIMTAYLQPTTASPAVPIWAMSAGAVGLSNNYFTNNTYAADKSFQPIDLKYLTISKTTTDGARFSVGYNFSNRDSLGNENALIASVDKKLTENLLVSVGAQSGKRLLGGINVGAAYNITPNATVSVGYGFYNNDNYELKNFIKTQLFIHF